MPCCRAPVKSLKWACHTQHHHTHLMSWATVDMQAEFWGCTGCPRCRKGAEVKRPDTIGGCSRTASTAASRSTITCTCGERERID